MVYRLNPLVLLWIAGIFLASCIPTEPVRLSMRYEGLKENPKPQKVPGSQACFIAVGRVVDSRSNTETIGHLYQAPVLADGVIEWLSEGLKSLRDSKEFVLAASGSSSVKIYQLEIAVQRVSVYVNPMRVHGTVVLDARLPAGPETFTERRYRGEGDVFAWTDSAGELMEALNLALTDVVKEIKRDLRSACGAAR